MCKSIYKWKILVYISMLAMVSLSCSSDKDSSFYQAAIGLTQAKIYIASGATGSYSVAVYDINGNFLKILKNYTEGDVTPRGLDRGSDQEVLVSLDRADHIERINFVTNEEHYFYNSGFSGNIYHLRRNSNHGIFVVESNTIESFSDGGVRLGSPRIAATVGACTLSTPRGMAFDSQNRLIVVGTGNDRINMYDVSDPNSTTCVTSNTTFAGGVNPVAVLAHSNGNIYVVADGTDAVYEFPPDLVGAGTLIFSDTNVINNPTAIAEMPDGSLLVGSNNTNSIVRMTTTGIILDADFINDPFTNLANDILIMQQGVE